jgi:hypothetical protein
MVKNLRLIWLSKSKSKEEYKVLNEVIIITDISKPISMPTYRGRKPDHIYQTELI